MVCYTEKAPNAWQRRGTQKTRNTYKRFMVCAFLFDIKLVSLQL